MPRKIPGTQLYAIFPLFKGRSRGDFFHARPDFSEQELTILLNAGVRAVVADSAEVHR